KGEQNMPRRSLFSTRAILALALLAPAPALAQSAPTPRAFDTDSNPDPWPYTDWAFGEFKAQCSSGGPVMGLSAYGEAHSVLCKTPATSGADFPFQDTSNDSTYQQSFYSSNSSAYGSRGDWDYGYYKGECPGPGRFVIGVSQTTS